MMKGVSFVLHGCQRLEGQLTVCLIITIVNKQHVTISLTLAQVDYKINSRLYCAG